MAEAKGYYLIRFANKQPGESAPSAASVTAAAPARAASTSSGPGKRIMQGQTIRVFVELGVGKSVATVTLLSKDPQSKWVACEFYPDATSQNSATPQFFPQQAAAENAAATPEFRNWLAGGLPFMVSVDLTQSNGDR